MYEYDYDDDDDDDDDDIYESAQSMNTALHCTLRSRSFSREFLSTFIGVTGRQVLTIIARDRSFPRQIFHM